MLGKIIAMMPVAAIAVAPLLAAAAKKPNIVLVMADDLGWGDVAYNGNPKVKTPALDRLAREGVQLNRFYTAPVCTPTRAMCMTGRNPNRSNNEWAGSFPLPLEERTIAEALKDAGYRTGHFGKWHLGKMTPDRKEGPGELKPEKAYVAPWHQGFEVCFSTESAAPNYNPAVWVSKEAKTTDDLNAGLYVMDRPIVYGEGTLNGKPMQLWPYGWWTGEGKRATGTIAGDSSELIMNHAIPFIEETARTDQPFLAVVWFVTPHAPVAAGPEFRALYPDLTMREQHWFGAISAMDAQVGRLLDTLKKRKIDENTIVWFCSDNGPSWVHELNSSGPLRGKKSEVYEGGIRVPAAVRWPAGITGGRAVEQPLATLDFLPTLLAAAGVAPKKLPPLDGENVLPVLRGQQESRKHPLFFDYPYRDTTKMTKVPTDVRQVAVIDGEWKLVSIDGQKTFELYNIQRDRSEKNNVAASNSDRVRAMRREFDTWQKNCVASKAGADYAGQGN